MSLSLWIIQLSHLFVIEAQEEGSEGPAEEVLPDGFSNPWRFRHFGFQTYQFDILAKSVIFIHVV